MKTSEKIQSYTSNKMLEVQNFINEIKSDLIGKSIEQILITKPDDEYIGLLGNYDCEVSKINENIELIISTTVFLKIENIYFSIGYERDNFKCINEGALFVYVDILPNKPDKDIIDLSHYYSTNTLNKKIMDIVADEYGEINFILENGYNFSLGSYDCDEVRFSEAKVFKKNEVNYRKFDNILYERYDLLNQYINTIKSKYIGKKN